MRRFFATSKSWSPSVGYRHTLYRQLSQISYELVFVTGDERGAETEANVHATLVGEHGELPVPVDNARVSFRRNSTERVLFESDRYDIGVIQSVRVGHDAQGTGSGWFLEKIILNISGAADDSTIETACFIENSGDDLCTSTVTEDKKTVSLEFPFHGWLGKSDSGGHDGPLSVDISPLPIAKWAAHDAVTPEELEAVLKRAVSHPLTLRTAGYCIPHPDKVAEGARGVCGKQFGYGGEDAYFSHPLGFVGVADGVYAWRSSGVDSGLYSQSLMRGALERAEKAAQENDPVSAMDLFHAAAEHAREDNSKGSSTACLFGLMPVSLLPGKAHVSQNYYRSIHLGGAIGQCVNLGDSGILICRPSTKELLFRTKHQEHNFGYPYQLGHDSEDSANDVQLTYVGGLQEGDVIVAATDGLFDNLSNDEIMKTISGVNIGPQRVAVELVRMAHEHSMSRTCETPYSVSATAEFDLAFTGGKPDDITCVVSYLVPAE